MKYPKIEKYIKKQGNCLMAVTGFFTLIGIILVSMFGIVNWITIIILGIIFAITLDAYEIKELMAPKKCSVSSYPFLYKTFFMRFLSINRWINAYLEDSESLVEKKYKIVCLSLWGKNKRINLNRLIMPGEKLFDDLPDHLIKVGETEFSLDFLFSNDRTKVKVANEELVFAKFIFHEDRNNPDKIAIAKKVYEEYAQLGMAAEIFLSNGDPTDYMFLQDYKFNPADYAVIESYTKKLKKQDNILFFDRYEEERVAVMSKIIDLENNIKNLKTLDEYHKQILKCEDYTNEKAIQGLAKKVTAKIAYFELEENLKEKENYNPIKKATKI